MIDPLLIDVRPPPAHRWFGAYGIVVSVIFIGWSLQFGAYWFALWAALIAVQPARMLIPRLSMSRVKLENRNFRTWTVGPGDIESVVVTTSDRFPSLRIVAGGVSKPCWALSTPRFVPIRYFDHKPDELRRIAEQIVAIAPGVDQVTYSN